MKLFKSRKTYYLYNPNTLSYERVYPSAKDRFFGVLRHLSIGIVIGVGIFFIFSRTFDSPVESLLKKENKLLQTQYEVLSLRLNNALEVLDDIQQRDENLYRAIFQAESIPESVRKSGFGGTNRYEHLMNLSNPELVVSTTRKMDMLSKQLYRYGTQGHGSRRSYRKPISLCRLRIRRVVLSERCQSAVPYRTAKRIPDARHRGRRGG